MSKSQRIRKDRLIKERDHTSITTTGVHLARGIGEALARSYKGELSLQYPEADKSVRVYWCRESCSHSRQ